MWFSKSEDDLPLKPKRSIFEDVGEDRKEETRAPSVTEALDARNVGRRRLSYWFTMLCFLVALTVIIGGLTRLTDSGLSITEWEPVSGMLPPMNDADWQSNFEKYQTIPEFQIQNRDMSLEEFKRIYWWEWVHRQLGRVIGVVWAAGFALFALAKAIPPGWTVRILGVGALIGAQGAIGWWMVASGLRDGNVDVSPMRLAVHLSIAFLIFGIALWSAMSLRLEQRQLIQARRNREVRLERISVWLLGLLFLQIILGALMAGLDAGTAFPTWPLMNGEVLPSESFVLAPFLANFIENPALVHFNHRMVGYVLVAFAVAAWWKGRSSPRSATRRAFAGVAALAVGLAVVGIFTAIYSAPIMLAAIHQAGALLLYLIVVRTCFICRYPQSSVVGS